MKTLLPLALAAAATLAASPAGAHAVEISDDGRYRIAVPYGDLNLATPAGVRKLEARLKAAARSVCASPTETGFAAAREVGDCRRDALNAARPQMTLALNRGKGGIALAGGR
jgi:UrcA family protein